MVYTPSSTPLQPGKIIDCTPENMGKLWNEIQELRSALRHVMYRTHPECDSCSGCELAKKQSELY